MYVLKVSGFDAEKFETRDAAINAAEQHILWISSEMPGQFRTDPMARLRAMPDTGSLRVWRFTISLRRSA